MALAEKALKVGGKTFEVADFKTISAAHFCFFSLQHDLPSNQETVDSCPYFNIFELIFELLIKRIYFSIHLIIMTIKYEVPFFALFFSFPLCMIYDLPHLFLPDTASYYVNIIDGKWFDECFSFYSIQTIFLFG